MDQLGSGYSGVHSGSQSVIICCLLDNGVKCYRRAGNACYNKRVQKLVMQRKMRLELDRSTEHSYICDIHKGLIQQARGAPYSSDVRLGGASASQQQMGRHNSTRVPVSGAPIQGRVGAGVGGRLSTHRQMLSAAIQKRARLTHDYTNSPNAGASAYNSNNSQVDSGAYDQREVGAGGSLFDWQQVGLTTLRRYKKTYKVTGAKLGASKAQFAEVISKHFRSLPYGNEYDVVKTFIVNVRGNRNRLDPPVAGQSGASSDLASSGIQSYVPGASAFSATA